MIIFSFSDIIKVLDLLLLGLLDQYLYTMVLLLFIKNSPNYEYRKTWSLKHNRSCKSTIV